MAQRTAHHEVLVEVVLPVDTEHRLPRLPVIGVALERRVHLGLRIEDALVDDGHLAGRVVYGIVGALGEGDTAGGDRHRALRHVVCTEGDDIGRGATELSGEDELVFLGYLLRHGLRGVVEFGITVFGGGLGRHALRHEEFVEIGAERFCLGQEHASVAHGESIHVVEVAIGVHLHVVVETVGIKVSDDGLVFHLRLRDIGEVNTCGVALELDVEPELLFLHRRGEVVDVFHHQPPVALRRVVAGVLQRLHEEALRDIGDIAGKLAHLIGDTAVGILEGDGKHLVGLQRRLERHVSEAAVHGIF